MLGLTGILGRRRGDQLGLLLLILRGEFRDNPRFQVDVSRHGFNLRPLCFQFGARYLQRRRQLLTLAKQLVPLPFRAGQRCPRLIRSLHGALVLRARRRELQAHLSKPRRHHHRRLRRASLLRLGRLPLPRQLLPKGLRLLLEPLGPRGVGGLDCA